MRRLIADATHLAFNRHVLVSGRGDVRHVTDERLLLDAVALDRAALLR
jgi:hypothetical protein